METEPDESVNCLIEEIWSLRRHLGEAKMGEMLQQQRIQLRRLTWYRGVAVDGEKGVGFVSPQAKRKREDKEIQTEPDESVNSLIEEIWSLRRHLGEAKTELETQRLKNRELQEELAALKNNFEGKTNSSEEKGRKKSEEDLHREVELDSPPKKRTGKGRKKSEEDLHREVEQLDSPPKKRKRTAKGRKKSEAESDQDWHREVEMCGCSGKCATVVCPCRKASIVCCGDCDCKSPQCVNRRQGAIKSRTRRGKTKR